MARPAYKPTAADRRMVSIAAGAGMKQADIAAGLGISEPTLRKHFEKELNAGAALRRMEVFAALHTQARKGSASAARAYLAQQLEPNAVVPPAEEKPAKKGKKQQANEAAVTADRNTDWDGLLPRNVVALHR